MSGLQSLENGLRALMLASLSGDAAAYRNLLSELSKHLRRYFGRRLHADAASQVEDLVQETLLAIHARRMTYDPGRPFTAWAYAIARYKLIDALRRLRMETHVPIEDMAEFLSEEPVRDLSAHMDLNAMLDTLPKRTGRLIRQVKIEGQSVAEVAQTAGLSESAVKVAVHRGLRALLNRFGGER